MASQVMRITLKAYDHKLVDASAKKIIETVKKNGAKVSGPVPLPTKKEVSTRIRENSSSREHTRDSLISRLPLRRRWMPYLGLRCPQVSMLISR